jgi:inorganic triphosphatase YgiF
MPQETELKLSLLPSDLRRLVAHPLLRGQTPLRQRLLNTYFDTPSLTLMNQRIAVRERRIGRQTLLTVKTAGSTQGGLSRRGEWEGPSRPGALDFAALVDDLALAQTLTGLAWQLAPVFRTDFVRSSWQLTYAGAHIEVALDQGHIAAGHAPGMSGSVLKQPLLELELELQAGPVDALLDLAHTLALGPRSNARQGIWLYPSARSKAERGLDLFLGRRPGPLKAPPIPLTPDLQPVQAFQTAALACLTHWQANIAPWLEDDGLQPIDPEFVHQARVALRRLRTGLRLFAPALPARFAAHWQARWKAAAHALGEARNWDVLASEGWTVWLGPLAEDPELQALFGWVQAQRQQANRRARDTLHQPTHALDLLAFSRAVLALPVSSRQRRSPPLATWALRRLRRQHGKLLAQTRLALREGPEGRHALRIELKKMRYAQEFLAPLLPARRRQDTARLVRAQTLLGEINDLSTAQTLLATCPLAGAARVLAQLETRLNERLQGLPRLEQALLRSREPGEAR